MATRTEGRTVDGFLQVAHNGAADTLAGIDHGRCLQAELFWRIIRREFRAQSKPAAGDWSQSAPVAIFDCQGLFHDGSGVEIAFGADGSRIGVFQFGAAVLQLLYATEKSFQNVHRFKAGHHNRHAKLAGDRAVLMIVQTWPAARKPCTRLSGEPRMARIEGGTSTGETSNEKLVSPSRAARSTDIAFAGAVVSKPTGPDARGQSVNREGHPFLSSTPYCREGIHDSQFTD